MPLNLDGIDIKCGGGKTIRIVKARRRSYGPEVCNEGRSIGGASSRPHLLMTPPSDAHAHAHDLKNNKARPVPSATFKDVVVAPPYKKTSFATWSHYHEKHKLAYLMLMSCVHAQKSPPVPVPGTSMSQADGSCLPNKDLLGESSDSLLMNLQDIHITN